MSHRRMVIYAKDIALITNKTERTGRRILRQIRKAFGKEKRDYVTIKEFCLFSGFDEDEVHEMLSGK
ncbi:hypothetical protein AAHN97_16130 [Chitinophaga niabensis]|uniref:hypothetical protein n=1 Tax=Chitinophaga niabensis TaxID=536979 RepID=UPI0031BA4D38